MPARTMKVLHQPTVAPQTDNPAVRYQLSHPPKPKKSKPKAEQKQTRPQIWAIDFDGTLHFGRFPNIGPPNEELIAALRIAKTMGVLLILWTSREGEVLNEAVEWCRDHGLEFDALNDNIAGTTELFGYNSRKVGADLYIDDRAMPWKKGGEALSNLIQLLQPK